MANYFGLFLSLVKVPKNNRKWNRITAKIIGKIIDKIKQSKQVK